MQKVFDDDVAFWSKKLNPVSITLPDPEIFNTLRANLGYVFVNKDGPAIQPGSRAYEAAWIRDGAMTSLSLLRMGYFQEVKEYIDWYAQHIYPDGRVPAIIIIGRNEINPVKEYDSQGEMIFAIWQYYQYTKDRKFLEEKFPVVLQSLKYLEALHKQRVTDEYLNASGDKRRFYNILPNSVSHEGYYPEPGNHSYWDDFWALRGWKDGYSIAKTLGKNDLLKWMASEEKDLSTGTYESMLKTIKDKNINYLPGCAELGDFDTSSTAIAIMVADEMKNLPEPYFSNTFDKYYDTVIQRLNPNWKGSFSPYEIRIVQAFLLMGQKDRAHTLLDYLLTCRRPLPWRQWPEALYFPDYRENGYIGDMPHTWVGSGYVSTIRNLLVYEKDEKLVLADGVNEKWLDSKDGVAIKNFPTIFGTINYQLKKSGNILVLSVSGDAKPKDGFVFPSPIKSAIKKATINNVDVAVQQDQIIKFKELPVEVKLVY